MTKQEAERILGLVGKGKLNVTTTDHFWERVNERVPGFTRLNIMTAVRKGSVHGNPVHDKEFENHKVTIRATVPGFGRVALVLAIAVLTDAVAVTVYRVS